ncbi:MAG: ABC transporter ATP-binding protein/permease [Actinomycetota bacterium]|nr:ABC transporter ATP-binding protein/permease [Actinomycetota bacterium]
MSSDGSARAPEEEPISIDDLLNPTVDRRLRRLPRLVKGAVGLVWTAGRNELIVTAVLQALGAAALGVQLLAGRQLIADLLATRKGGSFSAAVTPVIVVAIAVAVSSAASVCRSELQQLLGELVARHALQLVVTKASQASLLAFESPNYHDRLQRAIYNGTSRPLQLATGLLGLLSSAFGVVAVGFGMILIQPLFFALAVVAIIPVGLATIRAGRAFYRFGFYQTGRDRTRAYMQYLLTDRDAAKEIRAYDLAELFQDRYRDLYEQRIHDLRALVRKRGRQGLTGSLLTSVLSGGVIGLLIWFVSAGRLSLAGAGAAAAGLLLLGNQLQGLASGVGQIYESSLFVQDFVSFVSEPPPGPPGGARPAPLNWEKLTAEHVTFSYPRQRGNALTDVSLTIGQGEVIALVGENGSGKSTLAKIVAGLYPPGSGRVAWDDVDLASFDVASRSERVAVLFQDFVRYGLSVIDNVTMGAWRRAGERDRALLVAGQAGVEDVIAGLPDGWDTQLGPQFYGGIDLSGGQWQRVALARALFRDAPLVILDEPTAALDPRSEAELFRTVRELFAGKSVLLITHRFTSAQLADRIYVLEAGHVVEEGTHRSLLEADGLYAELFGIQAALIQGRNR